ncbi:hypothetical protein [Phocaeicola coprocola]|uniref:hypothetical protein n=1 Tax=Phocaeicola coprocola TaxID=310298 RepID=UPI00399195B3
MADGYQRRQPKPYPSAESLYRCGCRPAPDRMRATAHGIRAEQEFQALRREGCGESGTDGTAGSSLV